MPSKPSVDATLTPENIRAYQWRALKFTIDNPLCALFMDMGLGKTIAVLSAIKHLFHRNKMPGPVLVVAPIRVIKGVWRQEALKWSHTRKLTFSLVHGSARQRMHALTVPAHVYLINPEGVKWMIEYYIRLCRGDMERFRKKFPFKMLVVDECFTGDTLISTPNGKVRIDSLVPGDEVITSFGPRRVKAVKSHEPHALVDVKLSTGEVITCTPKHPFFTELGWVEAKYVEGRYVAQSYDINNLSRMQEHFRSTETESIEEERRGRPSDLLFEVLRSESNVEANDSGEAKVASRECVSVNAWKRRVEQGKGMGRGNPAKIIRYRQGQESRVLSDSSRQRHRDDEARRDAKSSIASKLHMGVSSELGWGVATWLSELLQIGFRGSDNKDRYRSGWSVTPTQKRQSTGVEERTQTGRIRVDSVSYRKLGGKQDVWNIQVEGCPHFYVGETSVLVHNSTFFKAAGTLRFKALKRALPLFDRRVILTGTPTPNSLLQLWSQMFIVDMGARLGTTFTGFKDRFFEKADYMGYSYKLREGAAAYINRLIKPIVLRLHDADWLELPPLIKAVIRVELPERAMKLYEKFEKEMFLELDTAEVEAVHAATLTQRCWQLANGAIYASDKETGVKDWHVVHDAKIEALKEYVEELGEERALIAYTFKHDLARLRSALPDVPFITRSNTERIVEEWRSGMHQFIFVHPQSAGHGINNLQTNCRRVLFFSIPWSGESYDQLIGRVGPARRTGEKEPTIVHHILASNTVDEAIMQALERKATTQRELLNSLRDYRQSRDADHIEL